MSRRFVFILMLAVGCQTGGDPLTVSAEAVPACVAPTADAAAPVSDAGAAPSNGLVLWFSNGLLQDMIAAGVLSRDYGVNIGDVFAGFVGYGMDVVTLTQSGRIAAAPGIDWTGPPTVLFADGRLAKLVWDGMTKAVVSMNADAMIRESPGGRVHCELTNRYGTLECAFHGVVRVEFR